MPGPAATIGSMHVCPMCSGTVPHFGGPISGPGSPNILINGKPAAIMGDMCTCIGPPDIIVQGAANVLFNGKPAVSVGDMTAHGGIITIGESNVLIGTSTPKSPKALMPIKKIPFPEITPIKKAVSVFAGHGKKIKEAEANQKKIREMAESTKGEPKVYGIKWIKEDQFIREEKVLKQITVRASVINVPDGNKVSFRIYKTTEDNLEEMIELNGTVIDKTVDVTWEEIQDVKPQKEANTDV